MESAFDDELLPEELCAEDEAVLSDLLLPEELCAGDEAVLSDLLLPELDDPELSVLSGCITAISPSSFAKTVAAAESEEAALLSWLSSPQADKTEAPNARTEAKIIIFLSN